MIVDNGKYYLYRHIRLDTKQPFYIGIGTKRSKFYKTFTSEYERAFSKNRSKSHIWNKTVEKINFNFDVEILLESDDYEIIKQKEIEFIKLYGRRNCNTGILANLTDGGEGTVGHITVLSEAAKEKMRNSSSCKKVVKLTKDFELIESYRSSREASRVNNISSISYCCRNKSFSKEEFLYRYEEDYLKHKMQIGGNNRNIIEYNGKNLYTRRFLQICKFYNKPSN